MDSSKEKNLFWLLLLCLTQVVVAATPPTNWRVEDYEDNNGEISRVLWFESKAGVNYYLQRSNDLQSWSNVQSIYGLGHEVTLTLFTYESVVDPSSPLNPPSPNDSTDPQVWVSIRIKEPTSGGVLLSWPSLEHGDVVHWFLPSVALVPEWGNVLLHQSAYEDHRFFLQNAFGADDPLPDIQPLGAQDAAMIAKFSAALPQINNEVANQITNSDTVAISPASGENVWFRLAADWGYSADGDYRPDWIEFEQGDTDAFSSDSNGDGILDDGDLDGDGIVDSQDAIVNDPLVDWRANRGKPYFILIPIEGLDSSPGDPLSINNQGAVAFANEIWHFDDSVEVEGIPATYLFEFPQPDGSTVSASVAYDATQNVKVLTDSGKLIGMAGKVPTDSSGIPIPVVWPSRNAPPQFVGGDLPLWSANAMPLRLLDGARDGYFLVRTHTGDIFNLFGSGIKQEITVYETSNNGATPIEVVPMPPFYSSSAVMADGKVGVLTASVISGGLKNFFWQGATPTQAATFEQLHGVLESAQIESLTRSPTGRLTLALKWDSAVWMRDDSGDWVPSDSLQRVKKLSKSGYGITSDGKIWLDGSYYDLKEICPSFEENGYSEPELIDINDGGTVLIQAKKGGTKFPVLAVKLEFQVPVANEDDANYDETEYKNAEELKIAKFEGGKLIQASLVYQKDIDRIRVAMSPVKIGPQKEVKITLGATAPAALPSHGDPAHIVKLEWNGNEKHFYSNFQFLVSDSFDDIFTEAGDGDDPIINTLKIGVDEGIDDRSHKAGLGSNVYINLVNIGGKTYQPQKKLETPINARRSIKVNLINPKKSSGTLVVRPAAKVAASRLEIIERLAQIGIEAEVNILTPDAGDYSKFTNIELPEGDDAEDLSIMTADERAVLDKFTDADQEVFEIVYIESFKKPAGSGGGTHGIAYSADRNIPAKYKNTALISEGLLQRLIVSHELGHLLTRDGHDPEASNLMSELVGQLSPANKEALESKRLSQNQEDEIYKHPAVKKIKKEQ